MLKIRKAVFPVAGLGTRFLPATKAMPKELLPIIDKPLVQFAVEEAIEAGITDLVFVTGRHKRAIEDHFDRNPDLEDLLARDGKDDLLELVRSIIPAKVNCIFVRQAQALGLGHAVLCARPAIGKEPFAVLLPDDLMVGSPRPTTDLVQHFEKTGRACLSVARVPKDQVKRYGIVQPAAIISGDTMGISGIVEKPAPADAPSDLAAIGRYVFNSDIFDYLGAQAPGIGREIQLTDSINSLAENGDIDAIRFGGTRYDCGSKFGYLEAIVDHAMAHPEFGDRFANLILQTAKLLRKRPA